MISYNVRKLYKAVEVNIMCKFYVHVYTSSQFTRFILSVPWVMPQIYRFNNLILIFKEIRYFVQVERS